MYVMPDTTNFSADKRALLEKYRHGEFAHNVKVTVAEQCVQKENASVTDSRVSLITVQSGDSKRPLFYFHVHWLGGAFYCFRLAQALGPDQPFYILEPYKFEDMKVLPTVEAMAADYIRSLRVVQPEGPYLLAGFCGGALLATEVTRQLRADGQNVDLLVLIEPIPGPIKLIKFFGHAIHWIGMLIKLSPEKQLDLFIRLRHLTRRLRLKYGDVEEKGFSPFSSAQHLRTDWMAQWFWVISRYEPCQSPGKMIYFWASDGPANRTAWWVKPVESDDAEFYSIPGSRETCLNDHLLGLAQYLKMCLNNVQSTL